MKDDKERKTKQGRPKGSNTLIRRYKATKYENMCIEVRYTRYNTRIYIHLVIPEDIEYDTSYKKYRGKHPIAVKYFGTEALNVTLELYDEFKPGTLIRGYINIVLSNSLITKHNNKQPVSLHRSTSMIAVNGQPLLRNKDIRLKLATTLDSFVYNPKIKYTIKPSLYVKKEK